MYQFTLWQQDPSEIFQKYQFTLWQKPCLRRINSPYSWKFFQKYQFTLRQHILSDVSAHLMAAKSIRGISELLSCIMGPATNSFRNINSHYGSYFFQIYQFTLWQQILAELSIQLIAANFYRCIASSYGSKHF